MSFKDTILYGLKQHGAEDLKIDREHREKGQPAYKIDFQTERDGTKYNHTYTFAKANGMSEEEILTVILSYLKGDKHERING